MKKRAIIIMLAAFITIGFTACKDNGTDNGNKPNPTDQTQPANPDDYKLVTELKGYTGKALADVKPIIEEKGFTALPPQTMGEIKINVLFSQDKKMYMLFEAKNLVCVAGYMNIVEEKTLALSFFENYSKECVAKMQGVVNEYEANITLGEEDTSFVNRQNFLNFYNVNKNNITEVSQHWKAEIEALGTMMENSEGQFISGLMYFNVPITPPSLFEDKANIQRLELKVKESMLNRKPFLK